MTSRIEGGRLAHGYAFRARSKIIASSVVPLPPIHFQLKALLLGAARLQPVHVLQHRGMLALGLPGASPPDSFHR